MFVKAVHLKSCISENLLVIMLGFVTLIMKEVIGSRNCGSTFAHFDYNMILSFAISFSTISKGLVVPWIVVGEGCKRLRM